MKIRKFSSVAVTLLFIFIILANASVALAGEIYSPSDWSCEKIAISQTADITPEGFDAQPYIETITRKDFCALLINTCRTFGTKIPVSSKTHPFTDTTDTNAEAAYALGLTQGTAAGIFSPDQPLSREMGAVMLCKMLALFRSASNNNNKATDLSNRGNMKGYIGDQYYLNGRNHNTSENGYGTGSVASLPYAQNMDEQQALRILSQYTHDSSLVSDWAKIYMADVYTHGILFGIGEGILDPKGYLTREQAVILSLNVLTYCDETKIRAKGVDECVLPKPTGIFISGSYYMGDVYLSWNNIPLASAYDITVYKNGEPAYSARIDSNYLDLRTRSTTYDNVSKSYVLADNDNPLYHSIFGDDKQMIHAMIKVVPVNSSGDPSVFSLSREFTIIPWVSKNEMIFGDPVKTSFASSKEASQNMTNVKVNIWKLSSSGTKTTSSVTLTVNKNVADNVIKIFADIYNGPEKFPIKSCGAYSYGSGKSEHSSGTAIDINPEENYFVDYAGKIKAGSLWKPGINPYSIPPDGDVVRAFNRYGWHWSPDMHWSNGADYMHFSLGGT